MKRRFPGRLSGVLTLASLAATVSGGFPDKPLARSLMAGAVYVRETQDQTWHIRVQGSLPQHPGLYAIVFNGERKAVLRAEIPFGEYGEGNPLVLTVPADGVVGEYAIRLVGQQENRLGLRLPLTDLPLEVYGEGGFALGYCPNDQARLVAFKAPEGKTEVVAHGWRANYRILSADGSVFSDSKTHAVPEGSPQKHYAKGYVETHLRLAPGATYWFDPYEVIYFGFREPVYLTFDPDRWFVPTLSLEGVKWWKESPK